MNKDYPLVSIITPTYNHSQYISECIDSVLSQTYQNWEMLIVNDGSTDNTIKIVDEYLRKDSRIKLYNQKNIGVFRLAETYNFALKKSSGKYIAILEGDDMWESVKLEKQVAEFEKNNKIVLCWSKAYIITDNSSVIVPGKVTGLLNYFNNKPIGNIFNLLFFEFPIIPVTILIKRDILIKIGGFIQCLDLPTVDISTVFEICKIGEFCYIDEPLAKWRHYANQVTKTYTIEFLLNSKKFIFAQYESLNLSVKEKLEFKQIDLVKYFDSLFMITYARSGRYKLIRKDFKGARKDYLKVIFYTKSIKWLWRLRAIIGFIFSLFHYDVEGLTKLLGKKTYKLN